MMVNLFREPAIGAYQVGFKVIEEADIVEIEGAYSRPAAIYDYSLAVEHFLSVKVYFNS